MLRALLNNDQWSMISHQELTRRHDLLRQAMHAAGHDAWLIAGHEAGGLKGYVRYVADWRITDGLVYVVLPPDGDPSMVMSYGSQAYWARQDALIRDVRTALDKPGEVAAILTAQGLAHSAIGVVGLEDIIPYQHGKAIMDALPGRALRRCDAADR